MFWVVLAGPQFLTLTLTGLVGVILAKCIAFTVLEKRLSLIQRPAFMLTGNIVSSVVGFAIALPYSMAAMIVGFVAMVGVLALLSLYPAKRLKSYFGREDIEDPWIVGSLIVAFVLTGLLFALAQGALETGALASYWMLKIAYVGVAFGISIFITVLFEEWVIWGMSDRKNLSKNFYPSVLKANLAAFLVAGSIGAAIMLPQRLRSPSFLVEVMEQITGLLT